MFEPMLRACPSFASHWDAFLLEWADEPELPLYIALAELARHLIAKEGIGDTSNFDAVFDVVERWHLEGDSYVKEAATIGLLEDLQNLNLHTTTKPDDFVRWLRPKSKRTWDKVSAFWSDVTSTEDD
ncbi:MAG TPA: hypothetical protein VGG10_06950 [Rhizomicrobium sp.]|jgi:hypothetical protein